MINKKVIVYDIESSFNLQALWSVYQQGSNFQALVRERFILCAAWKYLGDKKVHLIKGDINDIKKWDDSRICKELHKVLSSADILIAHNGDRFDLPMTNTRLLINGMRPLPAMTHIDTLKIARRHFKFNVNRLDYIGQILGVGRKMETGGFSLWYDIILNHSKRALRKMEKYNKQDVVLLEAVYNKLKGASTTHPHMYLQETANGKVCGTCGSSRLIKHGTRQTKTMLYQRYLCKDCGATPRDRTNLLTKEQKKNIIVN